MVQIAILCVLILIAILIAPWLINAVLAILALSGVAVFAIGLIVLIGVVLGTVWTLMNIDWKRKDLPEVIKGERKSCVNCQFEMPIADRRCRSCGALN